MIDWLPTHEDFRGAVRRILDAALAENRLGQLADLANHRLSFLEVIQLDRALARVDGAHASGFASPVRLGVLSSATVDQLVPAIRVAGLRRRLLIDVHVGPYGQYRQQVLDGASKLHEFRPQLLLFALTAREVTATIPLAATLADVDASVARFIGELRVLWRRA